MAQKLCMCVCVRDLNVQGCTNYMALIHLQAGIHYVLFTTSVITLVAEQQHRLLVVEHN